MKPEKRNVFLRLIIALVIIFVLIYSFYNVDDGNYRMIPTDQLKSLDDIMRLEMNVTVLEETLQTLIKCHDRDFLPVKQQRGEYWVLKNFIRADHGELRCLETLTYTTHSDYSFLDNLAPLVKRWEAPISVGMHTPGYDFDNAIKSIQYLRECIPESDLIRQYTTFHFFFSNKHVPEHITVPLFAKPYDCSIPPPYETINTADMYKTKNEILYPVNVGRNIARDAAMTHFIFPCDIELYPTPGLPHKFLEMIARNGPDLQRPNPRVFPLSLFEIEETEAVPENKTKLQELLANKKAIPFHQKICPTCHKVPKSEEWIAHNENQYLEVFHIGKRNGKFFHWEPIFIGTHSDPYYEERLSWEGQSDKMTQGYALCAQDYEFHILDDAFLIHRPGIKIYHKNPKRDKVIDATNKLIREKIFPELKFVFGKRDGCEV